MLLRHLYLYLHLDEYPPALATPFGFRTRYVCNFLERRLREMKFQAEGFSKICVQGRHQPLAACPIVSESAVLPTIGFDRLRYESLRPGEEHEFFIAMLVEGLERCAQQYRIPIAELKAAIPPARVRCAVLPLEALRECIMRLKHALDGPADSSSRPSVPAVPSPSTPSDVQERPWPESA